MSDQEALTQLIYAYIPNVENVNFYHKYKTFQDIWSLYFVTHCGYSWSCTPVMCSERHGPKFHPQKRSIDDDLASFKEFGWIQG